MRQNVTEVYQWVVDDVVQKVEAVFAQEGVDPSVLHELRESWSRRLSESGAMGNPNDELEVDGHDHGSRGLSSAQPSYQQCLMPTIHSTHHVGTNSGYSLLNFHDYSSRLAIGTPHNRPTTNPNEGGSGYSLRAPTPGYMQWPNHHAYTQLGPPPVVMNCGSLRPQILTADTGTRQTNPVLFNTPAMLNSLYSPANGNAGQTPDCQSVIFAASRAAAANARHQTPTGVSSIRLANDNELQFHVQPSLATAANHQVVRASSKRKEVEDHDQGRELPPSIKTARLLADSKVKRVIPQNDGSKDEAAGGPSGVKTSTSSPEKDLDDDDGILSDVDDEEESTESTNCLAAQYEKVTRIKNRWRCVLKFGIFHVEGKDYLFKQANGEFTF